MNEPHLIIDAAAPDEMKIANLAKLIRSWTGGTRASDFDLTEISGQLARECFRHGRQSGFRAALKELAEKLARTRDADAAARDLLADYGFLPPF